MHAAHVLVSLVLAAEEKAPDDEDVVAGWTGFLVFVLLIAAVAVIGFALTRSLRTAQRAKEQGVYGDEPGDDAGETTWAATDDDGDTDTPPAQPGEPGPDWR